MAVNRFVGGSNPSAPANFMNLQGAVRMHSVSSPERWKYQQTVPMGPQPYIDPIPEPEGVYPYRPGQKRICRSKQL